MSAVIFCKKVLEATAPRTFLCSLDVQQIGVDLQCAIGIMSQNLLCQNLTQLDTFLVKAVQVPCEALEHNLVLEVGQQRTQCGGGQLFG